MFPKIIGREINTGVVGCKFVYCSLETDYSKERRCYPMYLVEEFKQREISTEKEVHEIVVSTKNKNGEQYSGKQHMLLITIFLATAILCEP